ncbi:hypothetical protein BC739_006871 [Kutzneria viridogrisea]|uniref:Uncharacterized protein n=1 Tax=Kutzneria viridogrisea TaxID=47990 RepID=A0ABR6BRV3_9PSEU|nr:hypothetical protein [Kutzneria albida]MBA8929653.1 hypothetical protein [Kutzneria viridogrisea]
MTDSAGTERFALARWWWRTPGWSRLLTSLGGGSGLLVALTIAFGAPVGPPAPPVTTPQELVAPVLTTTTTPAPTTTTVTTTSVTTKVVTTTTTTTTQAPPPPSNDPPTYQPPQQPTTEPPSGQLGVTSGAFCSLEGALGVTKAGKPMVCKGPGQLRWRAA